MRLNNIPSCKRKSRRYPYFAARHGAMINTHKLDYPCLEHISMVSKLLEPLKFYCIPEKKVIGSLIQAQHKFVFIKFHSVEHESFGILTFLSRKNSIIDFSEPDKY